MRRSISAARRPETSKEPLYNIMVNNQETRFAFGKNWQRYLEGVTEERIAEACQSLKKFMGKDRVEGTFLDIGCGSGLFSLAAIRLGAARVVSFDYDQNSVNACLTLKSRFAPDAANWEIFQGSVLDDALMARLGAFDTVYSWGVLHHTGQMWNAITKAASAVAPGGMFFIAIYNTYSRSGRIARVKKFYCESSAPVKRAIEVLYAARGIAMYLVRLRNPLAAIRNYDAGGRGMSWWRDRIDWIGGYPYEHALPEEIFAHVRGLGFDLLNLKTCNGGKGCNEFLFKRIS